MTTTSTMYCGRVWQTAECGHTSVTRTSAGGDSPRYRSDRVPQPLANVYLSGPTNRTIPTGPGRSIVIRGGQGRIVDEVDMVHALRLEGATVVPDADRVDWIPVWLEKCGEFQRPVATIELPDGEKLYPPYYQPEDRKLNPPVDHGTPSEEISMTEVVSDPEPEPLPASHTSVDSADWFQDLPVRRGPGRPRKEQ